jgi:hypothetical protein
MHARYGWLPSPLIERQDQKRAGILASNPTYAPVFCILMLYIRLSSASWSFVYNV